MPASSPAALQATVLDTVVVSGKTPGPGLWKLTSPDGHAMWLLGTVSPLPKRMDWDSSEVEAAIAASGKVVMPPSVTVDAGVGKLRGLFLLPSLMKARNNPDRKMLKDMLPPALYGRWLVQKRRYLGRNRGVEKRRPLIAAQELHAEALDDLDLSLQNVAARAARKAAKKHEVPLERPLLTIRLENVKQAIRDFSATSLDDVECLDRTLARLENDIETLKLRANAWAMGETRILQSLAYTDTYRSCTQAMLETQLARDHGFADLDARVRAKWIEAVEVTMREHATSFGLLPMALIVREDGFVAPLLGRGYRLESPEERAESAEDDGAGVGVMRWMLGRPRPVELVAWQGKAAVVPCDTHHVHTAPR